MKKRYATRVTGSPFKAQLTAVNEAKDESKLKRSLDFEPRQKGRKMKPKTEVAKEGRETGDEENDTRSNCEYGFVELRTH
jgi:hypothetical protein